MWAAPEEPIMDYNCADDSNFEPKRQCCGYTIAIFMAILSLLYALLGIINLYFFWDYSLLFKMYKICRVVGGALCATFYILMLHRPNYLGGNPKFHRLWLFLFGYFLMCVNLYPVFSLFLSFRMSMVSITGCVVFYSIGVAISYLCYIKDDAASDSNCCSCWKPWVYKRKAFGHAPIMKEYPSYGAPAPQGYAPQGYPSYGQTPYVQAPYSQYPFNHSAYGQTMQSQAVYGQMPYGQQVPAPYGAPSQQAYAPQAPIQTSQPSQMFAQNGFSASPQPSFSSVPSEMPPQYREAAHTTSSFDYSGPKS